MKIAMWDIEATNLTANFGRILCACIKPLEKPVITYRCDTQKTYSREPWNDKLLCEEIRDALGEYDVYVTWYGKMYDTKFLQTRLLLNKSLELPKIKHIDLYYQSRHKLKLHSNRMEMVAEALNLPRVKKTRLIPAMWVRAQTGDREALDYVVDHCVNDVKMLEALYWELSKYIERITK